MPSLDWLRTAFAEGFDSGDVMASDANSRRLAQEKKIGGSYREVFETAVAPHLRPDSVVLELGPGMGSWSRAMLRMIPDGTLHTADFVDTTDWFRDEIAQGRVVCTRVRDNSFSAFENDSFDFFFSFGVICHNNVEHIAEILTNSLAKMKPGGVAVHQYATWDKLDEFGWKRGGTPEDFKNRPDDEIPWPRNTRQTMAKLAREAGWSVVCEDLDLLGRDGLIHLRRDA